MRFCVLGSRYGNLLEVSQEITSTIFTHVFISELHVASLSTPRYLSFSLRLFVVFNYRKVLFLTHYNVDFSVDAGQLN